MDTNGKLNEGRMKKGMGMNISAAANYSLGGFGYNKEEGLHLSGDLESEESKD